MCMPLCAVTSNPRLTLEVGISLYFHFGSFPPTITTTKSRKDWEKKRINKAISCSPNVQCLKKEHGDKVDSKNFVP